MMEIAKGLDSYEREILAGKKRGLLGAIQIGLALEKIREGNLWLNTGAKSFNAYASGQHGFSKSTAYNMMSVAATFGKYILEDPDLQGIEVTRLIKLLPHVKDSNEKDLLNQAAHIPDAIGFENQLRNMAGKVGTDECNHDFAPINIQQCKICGLRRKG